MKYQSFDDIYTVFMDTAQFDEFQLPQNVDGMYALLEHGIQMYLINYDSAKEIEFNRDIEMLNMEVDFEDVQIIVGYMQLNIYEKIRDIFISTYDVLIDDIGIRNYKSQVDAKENAIAAQNGKIKGLLLKVSADFDVLDDLG